MSITLVQSVSTGAGSVSSVTTAAITTTSGNLVVVDVGYDGGTFTSITDNKSNTWTARVAEQSFSNGAKGQRRDNSSITGGASHTFTLTCTANT